MEVAGGNLAVEEKGIYSVEKFITARRLMYWQVYLHKTVLAAERLLINIIHRARSLAESGSTLFGTPALLDFLQHQYQPSDTSLPEKFATLDDYDVMASIKVWCQHKDKVLNLLCNGLINRNLYKVEIRSTPYLEAEVAEKREQVSKALGIDKSDGHYFVFTDEIENNAYDSEDNKINILYKSGQLMDIATASDNFNIASLTRTVRKNFLCTWRLGA